MKEEFESKLLSKLNSHDLSSLSEVLLLGTTLVFTINAVCKQTSSVWLSRVPDLNKNMYKLFLLVSHVIWPYPLDWNHAPSFNQSYSTDFQSSRHNSVAHDSTKIAPIAMALIARALKSTYPPHALTQYLKDRFNCEYLILRFGYPSHFADTNNCGIEKNSTTPTNYTLLIFFHNRSESQCKM